jgi:cytochrome c-type biogenesis protein CcmH
MALLTPATRQIFFALSLLFSAFSFAAIDPDEFSSEAEHLRYQHFIADLRCPKCQNQNLAGSDAPIAADLRKELRHLLKEGQSDQQIVDFMVSRYGEFILYKPPLDRHTAALWFMPIMLLSMGVAVIGTILWRHRRTVSGSVNSAAALTRDEQAQVAALLSETKIKAEKMQTGRGKRA